MTWKLLLFGLIPLWATGPAASTVEAADWAWKQIQPSGPEPAARAYGTAVHDPVADRIILFGGQGSGAFLNDVWAFDLASQQWQELDPSGTAPSPRHGHNAIYDPVGHSMVVWAGQGAGFFNDVWVLELGEMRWRELDPANSPDRRYGSAAVFDPLSRSLVQFAGFTNSGRFNDTQSLDLLNETWLDLNPETPVPSKRCLHTAAFHAQERQMFMYGGQSAGALDDLWRFDLQANRWERLQGEGQPEGRYRATSFFDSGNRFLVFGGVVASGVSGELWSYDPVANSWERIEASGDGPSARHSPIGALTAPDRFYVFGGSNAGVLHNDLWQLSGPAQLVEQWLAQLANGDRFVSTILLANPYADQTIEGTVDFFGDGGPLPLSINGETASESVDFSLPALGTVALETSGTGAAMAGSARITSHGDVSAVLRFSFPEAGISGVAVSRATEGVIAPVSRSVDGNFSTGVAVVAVEGDPLLTMTLRDQDGVALGGAVAQRETLLFGHFSEFIEQIFEGVVPEEFRGSLTITSTGGKFAATAIEFGTLPGRFTSLPISDLR